MNSLGYFLTAVPFVVAFGVILYATGTTGSIALMAWMLFFGLAAAAAIWLGRRK